MKQSQPLTRMSTNAWERTKGSQALRCETYGKEFKAALKGHMICNSWLGNGRQKMELPTKETCNAQVDADIFAISVCSTTSPHLMSSRCQAITPSACTHRVDACIVMYC